MKLSTARKVVWGLYVLIILAAILHIIFRTKISLFLVIAVCIVYFIVRFVYLRCPHCGRVLDRIAMFKSAANCPYCGKELDT